MSIPGPWHASVGKHDSAAYLDGNGVVRFVYATQPDGRLYVVAKTWAGDDGDYASVARLIAAAPELLFELKHLLAMWEESIAYEPAYMGMANAARAAIAKAEGRGK